MSESGKERFILTKSYEIAYALFRIATQIEEKDFSEKLRASGTALLGAVAEENYPAATRALALTECFVKFAGDVNIMSSPNSNILLKEIYVLDAAIAEQKNVLKTNQVNLSEIFSNSAIPSYVKTSETSSRGQEPFTGQRQEFNEPVFERRETTNEDAGIGIVRSSTRQAAILEKIRQSGNCRLKEIQELLPECSERTIRYDLQSLLEQSLIERIGNGGPSVYYRIRQTT